MCYSVNRPASTSAAFRRVLARQGAAIFDVSSGKGALASPRKRGRNVCGAISAQFSFLFGAVVQVSPALAAKCTKGVASYSGRDVFFFFFLRSIGPSLGTSASASLLSRGFRFRQRCCSRLYNRRPMKHELRRVCITEGAPSSNHSMQVRSGSTARFPWSPIFSPLF